MKNVIKPLSKNVLIPLGLTAAAAADAEIHKKISGSGKRPSHNTILIISNDKMKDIIKIVKSLRDCGLLLKEVSETIRNEAKEQKVEFLSILLGALGASLLGNTLSGKGVIWAGGGEETKKQGQRGVAGSDSEEKRSNRQGRGIIRADYGSAIKNKNFCCHLFLWLILKYKSIIKMNLQ